MDDPRTAAAAVSSTGGALSKHRCLIGPVSTWASLPIDLLLEIIRRLESTAVIRCAATCRPWRRAIIGTASFLRPRPDRFLPSLLLGVFHGYGRHDQVWLRRTVGPLQSVFPSAVAAGYRETANSMIPSAAAAIAGKSPDGYGELLSSRDGFILLRGRERSSGLCLCNPMTGDCAFVPNAGNWSSSTYILLTGCDLSLPKSGSESDGGGDLAVRILAVDNYDMIRDKENSIKYQLFSLFTSGGGAGVWGPVRRSMELQPGFWAITSGDTTAVCRNVVYWIGGVKGNRLSAWTVALDVHTGRTWMTELPQKTDVHASLAWTLLATTGDGRLSLIWSLTGHKIQVWVLNGGDRWSLQHTVDVQKQLRHCQENNFAHTHLNAFCPRSGCVLALFADQEICIDLDSCPCPRIECIGDSMGCHGIPYEMDWSTYISKMKRF